MVLLCALRPPESRVALLASLLGVLASVFLFLITWHWFRWVKGVVASFAICTALIAWLTIPFGLIGPPKTRVSVALATVTSPQPYDYGGVATRGNSVDITLRNAGTQQAILTQARVDITKFVFLPACKWGSDIPVSGSYQVDLPDNPEPNASIDTVLHQQLAADDNTRFTLEFGTPKSHAGPTATNPGPSEVADLDAYAYKVRITLIQDGSRPPIDAGEFLVVGPDDFLLNHYMPETVTDPDGSRYTREESLRSWAGANDDAYEKALKCITGNTDRLRDILWEDSSTVMSPKMQEHRTVLER